MNPVIVAQLGMEGRNQMPSLLDQHADVADEPRMTSLAAVFDRSTRYELAFWDMAYSRGQSPELTRQFPSPRS